MINQITAILKRNGKLEKFNIKRIINAITNAFESVGRQDEKENINKCTNEVLKELNKKNKKILSIDDINNINIKTLKKLKFKQVARSYENYSKNRSEIRVLGNKQGKGVTDSFLMVTSFNQEISQKWDRSKFITSLINEAELEFETAVKVVKNVENVIISSKFSNVSRKLIREITHTELFKRKLYDAAKKYESYSISRQSFDDILFSKNQENSNVQINNPEAVNFTISGQIGKSYALNSIFSQEVTNAHVNGNLHIHDLDLPARVYCSAHSLEYIKKYGLVLDNLQTTSAPAKHTETLTGHINTFFAAIQTFYAGALGLGYINIFYAPLIQSDLENRAHQKYKTILREFKDVTDENIKLKIKKIDDNIKKNPLYLLSDIEIDEYMIQRGQELIYAASQNAFSRGGQTLFIDFNVHTGVPHYLENTLSIEAGGKYAIWRDNKKIFLQEEKLEQKNPTGHFLIQLKDPESNKVLMREELVKNNKEVTLIQKWDLKKNERPVTYKDYDELSKKFCLNLLKVWEKGDKNGQPFSFPKCDLHINKDTLNDPVQMEILKFASKIASKNGSPYFIFDRDEVSLAACCRLRTAITDNYVLKHPESMRFCGFQNITINLPQIAYKIVKNKKKNLTAYFKELNKILDLAIKAHIQKKTFIKKLQNKNSPQWLSGKPSMDGTSYINLEQATYIIGIIGLNETVQVLTGKEIHEQNNNEFANFSLKIIAHLYTKVKEYEKKLGLKFSIEESPAESAARRLSMIDLLKYPEFKKFIKGDIKNNKTYYTNSIHIRPDAPIDLITRIELQSKFHPIIESGAIIHAFIGDKEPNDKAILELVVNTFKNTQCAQLTISPDFTVCRKCNTTHRGLITRCPSCNNTDKYTLKGMSRIVGYYSYIDNWNLSKQEEHKDRHKGDYLISNLDFISDSKSLINKSSNILGIMFGKSDCILCKNIKAVSDLKNIAHKYKTEFVLKFYDLQIDKKGIVSALLSNVNLSNLPVFIILSPNSEIIYKGETIIKNNKIKEINIDEVKTALLNYFMKNSQNKKITKIIKR